LQLPVVMHLDQFTDFPKDFRCDQNYHSSD